MQRISVFFLTLFLFGFSSSIFADPTSTPGGLAAWKSTNGLGTARSYVGVATFNGYLYAVGGHGESGALSSVEYAQINKDGTVGSWKTTKPLPAALSQAGVIAYNGYIYLAGGSGSLVGASDKNVYYAAINKTDGSLGNWQATSSMIGTRNQFNLAVYEGYLYAAGGYDGHSTGVIGTVEYTKINDNGSLGQWQSTTRLPESAWGVGLVAVNERLYAVGGYTAMGAGNGVSYASINSNGSLSNWNGAQNLPVDLWGMGATANGRDIYAIGGALNGGTDGSPVDRKNSQQVYVAQADMQNGSIGTWYTTSTIGADAGNLSAVSHNGYVYAVGGTTAHSSEQPVKTVQFAKIVGPQAHIPKPPVLEAPTISYGQEAWKASFSFKANPRYSKITEYGFELTKGTGSPTVVYKKTGIGYEDNNKHTLSSTALDISPTSTVITYGDGTIYKLNGYVKALGKTYRTSSVKFADISPIAIKFKSKASGQLKFDFLFNASRISLSSIKSGSAKLLCDKPIGTKKFTNLHGGTTSTVEGVTYNSGSNSFPYVAPSTSKTVTCDASINLNGGALIMTDGLTDMEFTLP